MKRPILLLLLAGCVKDPAVVEKPLVPLEEGNVIRIVAPAGVEFDRVVAEIKGEEWQVIDTVEAPLVKGEVKLVLPGEIAGNLLMKGVREAWNDYEGYWPAREASDREARVAWLGDIIAMRGEAKVARLYMTGGESCIYYHYADRALTLGGFNLIRSGSRYSYRYEAEFKAGWNAYASVKQADMTNLITTEIPDEPEWKAEIWP